MKAGAGPGLIQPQTQACLEPREVRRGKEGFSPRALGRNEALLTPCFWTSGLQNGERINFNSSKPPNLKSFVVAALGNEYPYKYCPVVAKCFITGVTTSVKQLHQVLS